MIAKTASNPSVPGVGIGVDFGVVILVEVVCVGLGFSMMVEVGETEALDVGVIIGGIGEITLIF